MNCIQVSHLLVIVLVIVGLVQAAKLEQSASRYKRDASVNKPLKGTKKAPERDYAFEEDCLAEHNWWRDIHQAPDLVFDRKLAIFAKGRADYIAASDGSEFKHPAYLEFGENLAWHSRADQNCSQLVRMWYDEIDQYDFQNPRFSHETGHFTQLVWRATKRVGCARSISTGIKGGVYLVCNYDPPGNFIGEECENVRAWWIETTCKPSPRPPTRPTPTSVKPTAPTAGTTSVTSAKPTAPTAGTTAGRKPDKDKKKKKKKKKKKDKKKWKKNKKTSTTEEP